MERGTRSEICRPQAGQRNLTAWMTMPASARIPPPIACMGAHWAAQLAISRAHPAREIAQESAGVPQHKAVTKPDDVDLNQMTLFDTVKSDDIVREIEELQINEITPVEALNILSRMQSRLKNRWQEG